MIVYGYLLLRGAQLLSNGSELLLEVISPGIIGGNVNFVFDHAVCDDQPGLMYPSLACKLVLQMTFLLQQPCTLIVKYLPG